MIRALAVISTGLLVVIIGLSTRQFVVDTRESIATGRNVCVRDLVDTRTEFCFKVSKRRK